MKIICIGRNYAEHAAELHEQLNDSGKLPEEPMFFLKPDTALLRNNDPFYIPSFSQEVHYECELVVRINRVGKAIAERFAHRYYDEVGLGIDFTARDHRRGASVGELQGFRPLGGDLAGIRLLAGAGRRRAAAALHARRERGAPPERRHGGDALHGRPNHRHGVAVHDPAHGRPALHRNASRRGPRPPRRHAARCARRTRTVKFRHQMNLEKRLFRNRKKCRTAPKTFHL